MLLTQAYAVVWLNSKKVVWQQTYTKSVLPQLLLQRLIKCADVNYIPAEPIKYKFVARLLYVGWAWDYVVRGL